MARIADHIAKGAMAFLRAEYKILAIFVAIVAVLLTVTGMGQKNAAGVATSSGLIGLSFVLGAICSALAGFIGMRVATKVLLVPV